MMAPTREPLPFLLFASHPLTGHITPTLRVASALHSRGCFPGAFFLGPTAHRSRILSTGVTFLPLQGAADVDDLLYYSSENSNPPTPEYWRLSWQDRLLIDFQKLWVDAIPAQWASLKAALQHLHNLDPQRRVVIVCDAMFFGVLPLFYGAPLPDGITRPLTMALSIMVPFIRSSGLPPFFLYTNGPAHTSVSLEERKAHIATCSEDWRCRTADLTELMAAKMQQTGATTWVPEGSFMEISPNYLHHRAILQLGVPSFFLPRGDWPGQFKFIGVLPPAQEPPDGWPNLPEWWSDVTSASSEQGKKIVVVAQGTVEVDPHQLIIPTISALQDRNDVLLVAILGRKGARLPPHIQPDVPGNVRVTDFIHYDAILQHAHVWVHNAGYGAVQHGIAHAVPMVVTAEGQDKPENALRVAASGIGVNLGPSTPGPEQVLNAVNQVLDDTNGFQKRAREVREEAQGFRCFELVEKEILALVDPYSGTS